MLVRIAHRDGDDRSELQPEHLLGGLDPEERGADSVEVEEQRKRAAIQRLAENATSAATMATSR